MLNGGLVTLPSKTTLESVTSPAKFIQLIKQNLLKDCNVNICDLLSLQSLAVKYLNLPVSKFAVFKVAGFRCFMERSF